MEYRLEHVDLVNAGKFAGIAAVSFTALFTWPVILLELSGEFNGLAFGFYVLLVIMSLLAGIVAGTVTAQVYNEHLAGASKLTVQLEPIER